MAESSKALHTTAETRRRLCVGTTKLYELIAEGRLDARKMGGKTLITGESIEAFIESLPRADVRPKPPKAPPASQAAA